MQTPVRPGARAARMLSALALLALGAHLAAGAAPLAAQATGQVAGTVTGEAARPLAGATVEVLGTGRRAVTGADGAYTLGGVPAGTRQVRASALGHGARVQTVSIAAGQVATASFVLPVQAVTLDSIVAVGYTTQRRRTVSDAVANVSGEQIADRKVATVEEALRGRVPGVDIISTGEPGRGSQVVIRGQNFLGSSAPLYVVDGMYTGSNPNLNPDDIESIQVLKDASAAAQYGAQSANGVVVITTKRGRAGPPKVTFNTYYGFQDVPNRVGLVGAARWSEINAMARANGGVPADNTAVTANTDWQDAVFQRGAIQDHAFTVSGGTETASYLIGAGYTGQKGTIIDTDFNRYSFRVNSEARKSRWRAGENLALSRSVRNNIVGFPLVDAVRLQPGIPVLDPNNAGGWGYGSGNGVLSTFGTNPVGAFARETNRDYTNRVLGTAFGELSLIKGFRYRLNLGVDYQDVNWRQFIGRQQIRENTVPTFNEGTDRRDNVANLLVENLLQFEGAHGESSLNAVAGVTEQRNRFERLQAYRRDFPSEDITEIDAGTSNFQNSGYSVPSALRGYLARANYSYADRYLLTGTFRRDGSSRFGSGNKWGNFGSVSAGWVISDEGFFKSLPLVGGGLDYLKLRGSYGSLGNQDIGDFQYAASIVANQSYPFGTTIGSGSTQTSLANPDIRWQSQKQTNLGLDFNLLGNALAINADYYVARSSGLLVQAPIPWSLGATGAPTVNAGSVRNRGFEFGAQYGFGLRDVRMNAGLNLTTIHNEVTALGNGGQPIFSGFNNVSRTTVGGSVGEFFVLKTAGLFQSDAEVQAYRNSAGHLIQPDAKPGDIRYADLNDDGVINDDDRYVAGSPIPKLQGGFNFDATWHALNVGLALRGVHGNKIFNVVRYWTDRMDENSSYRSGLDPWTPTNTNTTDPRAVWGAAGASNARPNTDRWLEDGSYLRIQNLVLGYALPSAVARRIGVTGDGSRVYLNVQNLHTFTHFSNWDPEVLGDANPLARGIDDGRVYPNPRTFTLGLDLRL
ncbi:MAG: TonB-dependent outer membrane protein SusC/RagA [Gemmatimonadetes bacterium]|nr:TonB-dependent outer membrane protein SusC/RagA [Gemmatimonadota bacterium]